MDEKEFANFIDLYKRKIKRIRNEDIRDELNETLKITIDLYNRIAPPYYRMTKNIEQIKHGIDEIVSEYDNNEIDGLI